MDITKTPHSLRSIVESIENAIDDFDLGDWYSGMQKDMHEIIGLLFDFSEDLRTIIAAMKNVHEPEVPAIEDAHETLDKLLSLVGKRSASPSVNTKKKGKIHIEWISSGVAMVIGTTSSSISFINDPERFTDLFKTGAGFHGRSMFSCSFRALKEGINV